MRLGTKKQMKTVAAFKEPMHYSAGDVAGHDHAHHRAASQHRIDDQDAGRRNDQTGRCGSDVDGSSELFIVAFLLLHGDQNATDGNGSCNRGTGQRAEQSQ